MYGPCTVHRPYPVYIGYIPYLGLYTRYTGNTGLCTGLVYRVNPLCAGPVHGIPLIHGV